MFFYIETNEQRKDTKFSAEKAGFEVLRIVDEPTAAAIAYGFNRIVKKSEEIEEEEKDKKILVYDLGEIKFDVSIIRIEGSDINVIATGGDSHLGGEDFTNSLVEEVKRMHKEETGEVIKQKQMLIRLRNNCEEGKIRLSEVKEIDIEVGDSEYSINREKFDELNKYLFEKTIKIVNETLARANMKHEQIDDIILIGGSSGMIYIREYIGKSFPMAKINADINPNETVSQGAAIVANEILYENICFLY